ncbi:MAG: DUF4838 domain-containing protein [Planctomycetota bacterium]
MIRRVASFLLACATCCSAAAAQADRPAPARIVVPAGDDPIVAHAGRELQRFLAAIAGTTLPVVAEDAGAPGPAILLGPTVRARELGLVAEAARLGEDGVLLRTVGDDLVLVGGGARGHLYAVYELLERFLGCRFLADDCVVTPARADLVLPAIDHSHRPPFDYRELLCYQSANRVHAARQRLNGANINQCMGRPNQEGECLPGVLIAPFVHSAEAMLPSGTWFPQHPEYFGLVAGKRHGAAIGGQLCYTNADVLRHCTDWVLRWLDEHPEVACVDVSQNDAYPGAYGACECEACAAVVNEEGAQHGPILRFVNAIADAVAARHPGALVETLAYQYSIATPKVTRPRDNVVIRLCHHACYFHGIDCMPLGAGYRQAIDDWRKVAKNLYVWHYGVNFWSYLAPNPNLTSLAADIAHYHRHGVNGVMIQGDIQSPGGELAELRGYLCAQLLWDPTRDPLAIRREFCTGYYGPAAADVLEFLAAMDAWGAAAPEHIPMNGWHPDAVTPPAFVATGLATLARALTKAQSDVQRNRVEKLLLPLWYLQLAWPDRFGLDRKDGAALLARFAEVIARNGITTISEGPPNAAPFVQSLEAVYGRPAGAGK